MKWKRKRRGAYLGISDGERWSVRRYEKKWLASLANQTTPAAEFPTKRAAQKHCEERAELKPVQRWLNGEPWTQLPEGTEDEAREVARRHIMAAQGLIMGLETTHLQTVDTHNSLTGTATGDERMRYLALGTAHGMTIVGEACGALRDWAVGRLGK